ncbi:SDR family NAD(P)-dependent oxidoreductase [Erythrobacter sp.]|uniref:SDR family NAD(P)-dependent oxidoreductase n=1 Tax=Erythrobacter sp. TaxID=1042 RepID=UPI003C790F55
MMRLFIFGLGYTASRLAETLREHGSSVRATGSAGDVDFTDGDAVRAQLGETDHILSSVPPDRERGVDPVLERYGAELGDTPLHYLSSTGVYGDQQGAWVDEHTPTGTGRRDARSNADAAWLERGARIYRLPGIYGPGRSAFDRVRAGKARRIDLPGQVFSRIHVDDIVAAILASFDTRAPPGAYNIADDQPASGNAVTEFACQRLGIAPPTLETLEEADLSPMARGFYEENRRVANGKAKRVLGWRPLYPTYVEGLDAIRCAELALAPEDPSGREAR